MKSLKILSSALIFFLAVGVTSTFAQKSASVDATANLLNNLTVTGLNNLKFGDVTAGINDLVQKGNVEAGEQLGKFKIEGTSNASIQATIIFPSTLDLSGGGDSMPFGNEKIYGYATDDVNSATYPGSNPFTDSLSGFGAYYVWVGGTVQPSNNQTAGAYSASITLEASYN